MDTLQLGARLVLRLVHGNSSVPAACDLISALVILHFCLSIAWVMMYATSLLHTGMQLILGTEWCMATALSLVPFVAVERKKFESIGSAHVSIMNLMMSLKSFRSCLVVRVGLAMSAALLSLSAVSNFPPWASKAMRSSSQETPGSSDIVGRMSNMRRNRWTYLRAISLSLKRCCTVGRSLIAILRCPTSML